MRLLSELLLELPVYSSSVSFGQVSESVSHVCTHVAYISRMNGHGASVCGAEAISVTYSLNLALPVAASLLQELPSGYGISSIGAIVATSSC